MAVPGFPAADQSIDPGARIRETASQGRNALKQGEASSGKQSVDSFLQFLQGAAKDTKGGASEAERDEQAQASASLRLLALLFQLDPAQLKNLADGASQMTDSEGNAGPSGERGGNGQGLESLSRLLSSKGFGLDSELMAHLREILGQAQNGRGGKAELLALMREAGGNGEKSATQQSQALRAMVSQSEGSAGKAFLLSGERQASISSPGSEISKFVSALREASEQGRLSGEQLKQLARDLGSVTTQNDSQQKAGAKAEQLGRLAVALQQAEGGGGQSGKGNAATQQGSAGNGQPEVNLARLFLESFGKGDASGEDKARNTAPGKGGQNSLQLEKSLLQSLAKQGQAGIQKADISQAQSSARSEGSNPGVSTKAGEWGALASSSFRGAGGGSVSGSVARASQPAGSSSIMDNQVLQQVVSKFQTELQRGSSRINVRMHPPELGRVQLKLTSEDSNMRVQLQVQNSQVQGILERNMPALRQALEQQNLDFDSIQVSVESGQQEGSTGYSRQSESEFFSPTGWTGSGDADPEDQGAGIPAPRSGESGGLSLRV